MDPRRSLALDDLQVALRMMMVELEELAPAVPPAPLRQALELDGLDARSGNRMRASQRAAFPFNA